MEKVLVHLKSAVARVREHATPRNALIEIIVLTAIVVGILLIATESSMMAGNAP